MCELQLSHARKHPRSERFPSPAAQSALKRQKISHPSDLHPPPAFWDNLSKVWLTGGVLREFDCRSFQATRSLSLSQQQQLRRPTTRGLLTAWKQKKENWWPTQSAIDFIKGCTSNRLKDIKIFARHGGPDLSNLRGVRISRPELVLLLTRSITSIRNLSALSASG
jgi:hypothetical protein